MSMTIAELFFTDVETDEDASFASTSIVPLLGLCIFPLLGLCLSVLLTAGPQAADFAAVMQFLE
jgi:hypothetical protein